jgi:glycosyltransferase involved in cell wall biosynthesis
MANENKKTTVVFLNHWASRPGGAEYSLLDILAWAQRTWNVHLVSAEDGLLHRNAEQLGVTCHVVACHGSIEKLRRRNLLLNILTSWKDVARFIAFVFRLRRLILRLAPAFIHANVPKSHVALCLLTRIGYRGFASFHIREIFGSSHTASLIYRLLFPPDNAAAIAISNAVRNSLPLRIQKKTKVIYNGIAVADLPSVRQRFDGTLKLLYLGRIVPWKGCHDLVSILSLVLRRFPSASVRMSLVGDTSYWPASYRQELSSIIENLGLGSYCALSGHTDDTPGVFTAHHVFCNASHEEPFGRSIAEAQAWGMPVVAFDSGGVGEIIVQNETGFLITPGNYEKFAMAIGRFLQEPDLIEKLGWKGRLRALEHFNRQKQIPLICNQLEDYIRL